MKVSPLRYDPFLTTGTKAARSESVLGQEDVVYWGVFPTKTIEIKHKGAKGAEVPLCASLSYLFSSLPGRDKGLTEKKDAKTDLKRPPTEKEKEDQQADKKKVVRL